MVKATRELHRMSECKARGEFLVEGTHQVVEAVAVCWPFRSVFWTNSWAEKQPALAARLLNQTECYCVGDGVLDRIATTQTPDGVVAVAEIQPSMEGPKLFTLGVFFDAVQDPGNMGTVVRAAAAAGADGVFASSECVHPFHPKVIRASAGLWFRSPPRSIDRDELFRFCRSNGIRILAAAAGGGSYWETDLIQPCLLVLGNEGAGLSESVLGLADDVLSVPMNTDVESLNVAMTGTLLLYEARRQRHTRPA